MIIQLPTTEIVIIRREGVSASYVEIDDNDPFFLVNIAHSNVLTHILSCRRKNVSNGKSTMAIYKCHAKTNSR